MKSFLLFVEKTRTEHRSPLREEMPMNHLFAPWRMRYIKGESRTADDGSCLLCEIPREGVSRDRLVLYRGNLCYVVMNAFPYTSGHLMVVPLDHGAKMGDFPLPVLAEMTSLLRECERIIDEIYRPGGVQHGNQCGKCRGSWNCRTSSRPYPSPLGRGHEFSDDCRRGPGCS